MRKILAVLIISVMVLVGIGLVVLASASMVKASAHPYYDPAHFIRLQLKWLAFGVAVCLGAAFFDYRIWQRYPRLTWLCAAGAVGVLTLVLVPAFSQQENLGSARWLSYGGHNLGQPSEFAKLAVVVVLAVWLDKLGGDIKRWWKGFFLSMLIIGVVPGLLVLEPDYGGTVVVGVISLGMYFVAGAPYKFVSTILLLGGSGVGALVLNKPNRMRRILSFFENVQWFRDLLAKFGVSFDDLMQRLAKGDISSAADQVEASLQAFINGGLWGCGYTESNQKHYWLPESHTDFIFSIGGEEFGLLFSLAVPLLFLTFAVCGFLIACKAADRLGRLMAFGMTLLLLFQAMFNLGVVTKCLPTKGITLPFISYGGTSLIVTLTAVGVLINIGSQVLRKENLTNTLLMEI